MSDTPPTPPASPASPAPAAPTGPPTVTVERLESVATVWLNRPQVHNAFNEALIEELTAHLQMLNGDASVSVVVLAGRGRSFCSGADLEWMRRMAGFSAAHNLRDATALAHMLHTLASLSKPTVARVQGFALAGGTGLVAACDIAVASDDAHFGTTEVRFGLLPATISPYVIDAIGARATRRYFLTGERIDAATALRLGLVQEVCPAAVLDERVGAIVQNLRLGAPGALAACKQLVRDVAGRPLTPELIADTSHRIATARWSPEAKEGIAAFFEKRPPDWQR